MREMTMYDLDNDDFPVKCVNCKHEFFEKVGTIKNGSRTQCPDCKLNITHSPQQFAIIRSDPEARGTYLKQFLRLSV
jgi:hypothetical protein